MLKTCAESRFQGLRKWAGIIGFVVGALAVLLVAGCRAGTSDKGVAPGGDQTLTPAIDFTLAGLDGQNISLSDLKGKVVLINFWTTWCPACREEMPLLQAAYHEKQSSGLIVLGVDLREDKATVGNFLKENGVTFPVVLDTQGKVSSEYNVYYIPHTVIVDREGKMRRVKVGAFASKEEILAAVKPFMAVSN